MRRRSKMKIGREVRMVGGMGRKIRRKEGGRIISRVEGDYASDERKGKIGRKASAYFFVCRIFRVFFVSPASQVMSYRVSVV
jgi:hypothetical protein